ncbi:hypothetical protein AB1Y20_004951 [Prymnesium parvum]|uniref:BSD domain-containing protein n=1 Tax=Prymnesium parvum TaxID=97485 RepID=A0AB34J3Y4_PRYPA
MAWLSAAAAAASSFVQEAALKVHETIEHERSEFLDEYSRCRTSSAAPPPPRAAKDSKVRAALDEAKRMGVALFNPFDDQDSLERAAAERPARVIMLPWEMPGISEATRARMRALSQERATFLAPPVRGSSSYVFALSSNVALVMEALNIDQNLQRQRHLLVPEQISEELFFQNYFHHLHVMAEGGSTRDPPSLTDGASVSSPSPVLVTNSDKASSEGTEVPSVTPLEEAFECISEKFSQESLASEVALRLVDGANPAASLPGHKPSLQNDAASSWEEELRAELNAM